MTAGTNHALMRSTSFWTGAFEPWASRTERTIRASSVSAPTPVTATVSVPFPLSVPAVTRSPACFSTACGSPVSILSSTADTPAETVPSTGTRSPGRTATDIPGRMSATGVSDIEPSSATTIAVAGCRPISAFSAAPVLRRERISISFPVSTNVTIIAAPS